MRLTRLFMLAGSATAMLAVPALAQGRPLPVQKPPTRAQTGTGAPSAPPPQARQERGHSERADRDGGYYRQSDGYRNGYVPVKIEQNGLVYGNFGYGYERVARQCTTSQPAPQTAARQPTPQAYSQPQLTQPVPRPQSYSPTTTTLPSGYSGLTSPNTSAMHVGPPTPAATAACWSRSGNGTVTIRR